MVEDDGGAAVANLGFPESYTPKAGPGPLGADKCDSSAAGTIAAGVEQEPQLRHAQGLERVACHRHLTIVKTRHHNSTRRRLRFMRR